MVLSRAIVKFRIPILILTVILLIPSLLGMIATRINYDMLSYLPEDIETVIGQNEMLEEFNKGAISIIVVEDMPDKDVSKLKKQIEAVDHVDTVLWYDSLLDISIPMELIPDSIYKEFNTDHSTLMAVIFDSTSSSDETMEAFSKMRSICGKQCFISGMTAVTLDLKELCEREEVIYVAIAVVLVCIAMMILLDSWLTPYIFLISIGIVILFNMGTNYFFGEISFITQALSAVIQLAVTMDYSIFLWHSYQEQLETHEDRNEAMAYAIKETMTSIVGSSVTTIAGFIALCFMSFTLGMDIGVVMAKGVVFGVIGCITILPSMILVLDKPLSKTKHKPIIPKSEKFGKAIVKIFPVFIIIFALLITPAYYGYNKANSEVYYDLGKCMPDDMDCTVASAKLSDEFNVAAIHMLLVDSNTPSKTVRNMINEMEEVDGVKYVLGLETVLGSRIPEEVLPESIIGLVKSDKWELLIINSEYSVASDEVNEQITTLNQILKKYDPNGMLIGEAPCMKDMIEITDHDFEVVNIISIVAIFIIIFFVSKSLTLPIILIALIELGIFINLGLPHYLGQSMSFLTPICISTIQLGATVDYAIFMTTRYKTERIRGADKKTAVIIAIKNCVPSIIVSGSGLFCATFGVGIYSDIEIISSMCMLLARGAVISMLLVTFVLPAMFMLFDKIICKTTLGMLKLDSGKNKLEVSNNEKNN